MSWQDVIKTHPAFIDACKMNRKGCKKDAVGFNSKTGTPYCKNEECKEMALYGFSNKTQERLQ